jgi:hypothetical protein
MGIRVVLRTSLQRPAYLSYQTSAKLLFFNLIKNATAGLLVDIKTRPQLQAIHLDVLGMRVVNRCVSLIITTG